MDTDTKEVLESILATVSERQAQASQRYLVAKASADSAMDRQGSIIKMGMNEAIERQMKGLADDMDAIISEMFGQDWRDQ